MSFLCFMDADRAGARQWATRAHDLAVCLDDTAALARAEYAVGRLELEEDPEPGRETVLRARALAEESGLEAIAAETYVTLGEIDDGLAYCHEHGIELIELYLDRRPRRQTSSHRASGPRRRRPPAPSSDDARSRRSPRRWP